MKIFDVIVIGGGQSGLSVGFYLRKSNLKYIILDQEEKPGGAWQYTWNSLQLFSPAQWSSLPGVIMPGGTDYYPSKDDTIDYLTHYEEKYQLNIKRPVVVYTVQKMDDHFHLETSNGLYKTKAVVSATGTFRNPYMPEIAGREKFQGEILHSSEYVSPESFRNKKVAVIGSGNSGAQILAEVSSVTETIWITENKPKFLADDIDGRYLFDIATKIYDAKKRGEKFTPPSLGDIVMVDSVKDARERGVLKSIYPSFDKFYQEGVLWENGRKETIDAVIFCTGFKASLDHLDNLKLKDQKCRIKTNGTQALDIDGLWLVGYGSWTGFASATLIGVGRSSRTTVKEISNYLQDNSQ